MVGSSGAGTVAAAGVVLMQVGGATQQTACSIFDPNTTYTGTFLKNIAACFDRYRLRKLRFIYKPIGASTSSTTIFIFAACGDPGHNAFTASPPTAAALQTLTGCQTFVCWQDAYIDVVPDPTVKFCGNLENSGSTSDIRSTAAGVVTIICPGGIGTLGISLGMLFAAGEIEFLDPNPVGTSAAADYPTTVEDWATIARKNRIKQRMEDEKYMADPTWDVVDTVTGRTTAWIAPHVMEPPSPTVSNASTRTKSLPPVNTRPTPNSR